jgi:hypothetical protein
MNINNSEYLLSQYADDSSLILDGGDDPLRKSLYILENFSEGENLKWNQSGKFKLLGINYDIFTEDKTAVHFKQKNRKNKNIVKFLDLSGSDLYGKNYSNKIFGNDNFNPISHCFAQPFR